MVKCYTVRISDQNSPKEYVKRSGLMNPTSEVTLFILCLNKWKSEKETILCLRENLNKANVNIRQVDSSGSFHNAVL